MLEYHRVIHTEATKIIDGALFYGRPINGCILRSNDFTTTIRFYCNLYDFEVGNVISFYPMNYKINFFQEENKIPDRQFELKFLMSQLKTAASKFGIFNSSYCFFHVFESNGEYFRNLEGYIEDDHHALDGGLYFLDVHSNIKNLSLKEFSKWHKNTYSHLSPNQLYEKMIERFYL